MARTILVVEDQALIGLQTKMTLERYGFTAETVISGEDAIRRLTEEPGIDAVLMDIDLGPNRMSGVEAAQEIDRRFSLPVVFCSAHTDPETIQRTTNVTKYGYVQKSPGNEQFLLSTLHMAMELHATHQRLRRQEEALQQENQLLQRFFEQSESLVAYLDRDFNFVRVNNKYANNSHCRPEELVGKNHFELYPNEENERIFKEVVRTGEPHSVRARPFQHPDQPDRGTTYWDWTVSPVQNTEGTVTGLIFTLADVTGAVKEEKRKNSFSDSSLKKWFHEKAETEHRLKRFETVLSAMHEGLVIHNPDGTIQSANHRAQEIFQMDEEALKKLYPPRTNPHTLDESGHELSSENHPVMVTVRTKKPVYGKVIGLARSAGDFIWISVNSIPFFADDGTTVEGIVTTFRDVTVERVHHQQIERILDSIDSLVFVTNLDTYNIQFANAKMRNSVGNVIGLPCHQVFCDQKGVPRLSCARRSLWSDDGYPNDGDTWEFQQEETNRWFRVYCKAIPWPGGPWARMVIATDITETKEHEKELELLLVEMNHRVKNNLAHVIAVARIELQSSGKDKAASIENIVQRIQAVEMLHDMLYSSRTFSSVELRPYITSLLASLAESSVSGQGISLIPKVTCVDSLSVQTKGGTKLGLILAELVSNTLKHGKCTGTCHVSIAVTKEDSRIVMTYTDDGVGFEPKIQQFSDISGGTGMMLIVALAGDLQGEVTLDTAGPGAGFSFTFPSDQLL